MARDIGPAGRALIKSYERGPRGESPPLYAYLCPAGKWTIGWGHIKGVHRGMTCTLSQAEQWFTDDMDEAETIIERALAGKPANDHEYSAMVSLAFNCGPVVGTSTMIKLHRAGNKAGAAREFPKWCNGRDAATGRFGPMPGLVRRRAEEAALYLRPALNEMPSAMPQSVEPPKSAGDSTTLKRAGWTGLFAAGGLGSQLNGVTDTMYTVQSAMASATGIGSMVDALLPMLPLILGVAAVAGAGFLIWRVVRKIRNGSHTVE